MSVEETHQYLTFTLDESLFAISIEKVREVLELSHITRIPRMPGFLRGVINVRGHAVPVADMRAKFELPDSDDTVDTCIIIVEVMVEGECSTVGALVDAVNEVAELPESDVEPPPRMGLTVDAAFIRGMARRHDDFVMILDVDRIFSDEEMVALVSVGGDAPDDEEEMAV